MLEEKSDLYFESVRRLRNVRFAEKLRVLVVDDSPLIIKKVIELLEPADNITELRACETYTEAMDAFHQVKPEVILLDINLRYNSGINLLKHVKTTRPQTVVIMFSNQNSYSTLCYNLGADCFIDKSKNFDKMPQIICSLTQKNVS